MSAPGLRLRGAVPPKEHNHGVSGNSDTNRVRNLDLHAFTGSTIAAALSGIAHPTDQDEQSIGTLWTDSAGKISLLAPTSQVKEPGLSLALHRYSVYASSIFAPPYSA